MSESKLELELEPELELELEPELKENKEVTRELIKDTNTIKKIFYNPKDKNIRRCKPIIFDIYVCVKCQEIQGIERGSWCCLVIRQSLDNTKKQTTYMLSGIEQESNHVKIRLLAIKEGLDWIINSLDKTIQTNIEINIICSDVFIVNLLRDWIKKWAKTNFLVDKEDRPNKDLLCEIMNKINDVKLDVKWRSEETNEMIPLLRTVETNIRNLYSENVYTSDNNEIVIK